MMPNDYVITIRGQLEEHWSDWFDGMAIAHTTSGETMLSGPVTDQAALHGLLAKIRDLGLPLIAVMPTGTSADGKSDVKLHLPKPPPTTSEA